MNKPISVSNLTLDLYLDYVRPAAIAAGIIELTVTEDGKQVYVTDTATADEIAHCMYCACMCAGNDGIERTHEEYVRHEAERMIGQLEVSIKYDLHGYGKALTALLDAMTAAQQPQDAPQEAPAAEAEQQPTETENAPQAATQAAEGIEITAITYTTDDDHDPAPGLLIHRPGTTRGIIIGDGVMLPDDPADLLTAYGEREYSRDAAGNYIITTDEKKEAETMTTTEREALERINARQNAANLFTNITPADIAAELAAMEAERTTQAADPDAVTLAPADAAQVWTEDGNTITPEETTTNEQKEEDNTMSNPNKLYLSNWDYNAALIIEELAAIVKNNGGTVKPGTETIIENRALNENMRKAADRLTQLENIEAEAPGTNEHRTDAIKRLRADIEKWERIDNSPRTVHHCTWHSAYISFKLGGMYYYYQTDSNPFFDFHYQKTQIDVNGTVSRCACLENDPKEWLYDCFFRAEATDADRREAANLIYNMLVKAAPSVIRRDSHRVRVRNQYDGRYHYETVYEKERRETVNF